MNNEYKFGLPRAFGDVTECLLVLSNQESKTKRYSIYYKSSKLSYFEKQEGLTSSLEKWQTKPTNCTLRTRENGLQKTSKLNIIAAVWGFKPARIYRLNWTEFDLCEKSQRNFKKKSIKRIKYINEKSEALKNKDTHEKRKPIKGRTLQNNNVLTQRRERSLTLYSV